MKERDDEKQEECIIYNFILTDVYGDTYETCYRMYKRTSKWNYEHIDMYESLYDVAGFDTAQDDAMALKDWMKTDDAKEIEREVNSSLEFAGISFKLVAAGDFLVYEYTLVDGAYTQMNADEEAAAFQPTEETKDDLRDVCKGFEADYGIRLGGLREIFFAADGTKLYSVDIETASLKAAQSCRIFQQVIHRAKFHSSMIGRISLFPKMND